MPDAGSAPFLPSTKYTFRRRKKIPLQAEFLWQIKRGAVRTFTWTEDGTLIVLGYWGPGEVVGQAISRIRPFQIECLTDVDCRVLPSHIWEDSLKDVVQQMQQTEELVRIIRRESVALRLWEFLIWLDKKFGCDVQQGRRLDLPITHQDIADTIGSTRVTVTRMLQQLSQEEKILRQGWSIILCDSYFLELNRVK
ncbi:Crp/Fnr family transcriptional regulator [Gloeocapsopsis dulcis]|uniref:Replication/maintenance protein n=1 Tax=Gloeocapsopsis dulcis AAB1 = 1H9 TaxID=1433147 RepID=A0A6N8G1J0_9CHRO|nr:Crp/Fnr family transcriptional regulator [Gloeocapsopsis dulcis]MUL38455.1 replication/maintenance protein [Gloeocapsopsis dulcis AAB1 = 1H9]WNN89720.1 Crp/Fnr family transcriptional regulator [Gloeocapsopsis dulcis]